MQSSTQDPRGDKVVAVEGSPAVRRLVEELRLRLLDLTTRSPLIAFRHTARNARNIRLIDEVPDQLYERLDNGSGLRFKSLGEQSDEPDDEKTIEFRRALDAAKSEDEEFIQKVKELREDVGERVLQRLECELRQRLRERLGMPPRILSDGVTEPAVARRRGLNPSFDLPVSPGARSAEAFSILAKHSDAYIQTLLFEEEMQRRLGRIRERVRLSLSETGVNPLFGSFGFLEWYESPDSQTALFAPLLLYPLEMNRNLTRGRYRYQIISTGDAAQINVALRERLRRDFDIVLPDFNEEKDTPEKYWLTVQNVIEGQKGWRIRRWVTIGLFSFARIAMWNDTAPENWKTQGGLEGHPGLRRILAGGGDADCAGSLANVEAGETDAALDSLELELPLVADADGSQLAAVREVLKERDLVIEGPPGTGKSQTITNIIAVAMSAGKTVLFIAEKMAALEVVRKRLGDAQLGDFCLELHSTKAQRDKTAAALKARLERRPSQSVEAKLNVAKKHAKALRSELRARVEALATPAGNLGITIQQLIWRVNHIRARTAALPPEVDEIQVPNGEGLTDIDVGRIASLAEQAEQARGIIVQACGSVKQHPWYGVARHDLDLVRSEQIVRSVKRLASAAARVETLFYTVAELTGWHAASITGLKSLGGAAVLPAPEPDADERIIAMMAEPQGLASLERFVSQAAEYAELRQRVAEAFVSAEAACACTSDRIRRLARDATEARFGDATISEFASLFRTRQHELKVWEAADGLLRKIAAAAGWTATLTVDAERALVHAVEVSAAADGSVMAHRSLGVVAPGASDTLRRSRERSESLRARRDALGARFSIQSSPDPEVLRRHATAIRAAPIWPLRLFSSRWRQARAAFRGLCRVRQRAGHTAMAVSLEQIAALKDELAEFAADPALISCVGTAFKGVDSDLAPLLRTAAWADRVRAALPADTDVNRHLRVRLFEGTADQIEVLATSRANLLFEALRRWVAKRKLGGQTIAAEVDGARLRLDSARRAQQAAADLKLRPEWPGSQLESLAEQLARMKELCDALNDSPLAADALGPRFAEPESNTTPLQASARHVRAVNQSPLPPQVRDWLLRSQPAERLSRLRPLAQDATSAVGEIEAAVAELSAIAPVDFKSWLGAPSPLETTPGDLRAHAERCANDPQGLDALIEDARSVHAARQEGLGPLLDLLDEKRLPWQGLANAAKRIIWRTVFSAILMRLPPLANFTGDQMEHKRAEFRGLDREILRLTQAKIAFDLSARPIYRGNDVGPKKDWTGYALICNEVNKEKRHISIRDLLKRAGKAVQQLMPCFMMSPISVAQFLEPDGLRFDLVVMDEASQIRPEDAMGAIARGRHVVIVGDPKQLPPTAFFMERNDTDSEDETTADEKSILEPAMSILRPACRLNLHYRSRHPSLIAYSNREFYDDKLVIFPSPYDAHPDYGVKYVYLPKGRYRGRVNAPEASEVARAAVEYIAKHLERSLGIVTLNLPQAELLAQEIDRLAAENEDFEAWRRKQDDTLEPFFVKNLENVQGDERDVIFISTVYGRDDQGNFYQRFGPINNEGGHRRLNVLFTRAKFQTVVFSSMDPGDIGIDETTKRGPRVLKRYLQYAKDGRLDIAYETGEPPESDFEVAVAEVLRAAGYNPVPQVGVGNYRIDIGVRHPQREGEFVLGVECDGARYHSTRSARERDRIRQEHLENLKWRIHRIWSLDWYRSPARESERLLKSVREAVAAAEPTLLDR